MSVTRCLTGCSQRLDFVVVIIGILDFIPSGGQGSGNLSALRSLRVLRPLRAVNKFPELKFLVVLLLQVRARVLLLQL